MESDNVEILLECALYMRFIPGYERSLVVLLSISASLRHLLAANVEKFNNLPLTRYFNKLASYPGHVPVVYRAKFHPRQMFVDYMEDRLSNKDFRPIKLYFEQKKKPQTLPLQEFKICMACARKRFVFGDLKAYLCDVGPCDVEPREQPAPIPEPKPRLLDLAVGPGDRGFDDDWITSEAKRTRVEQRELSSDSEDEALTEEEKNRRMVEILTKKDATKVGFMGFSNLFGHLSAIRRLQPRQ